MNKVRVESWDWSKYNHRVEIYKNDKGKEIRVDSFQRGNSSIGHVKFVNTYYGMSVYGDFGNWIFCRPFVPSSDGFVSDGYWLEKLRISSQQSYTDYDGEGTHKAIEKLIEDIEAGEWYSEEENQQKAIEWLNQLKTYTDDELEYTYEAFRGDNPTEIDYEYIPFEKTMNVQLLIVFDVFDEICRRLKEEENKTIENTNNNK